MTNAERPTDKRLPRCLVEIMGQEPSLMPAGRTLLLDRFLKRNLRRWELTHGRKFPARIGIVLTTTVSPTEWRMTAEVLPVDELPAPRSTLEGELSRRIEVLLGPEISSLVSYPP